MATHTCSLCDLQFDSPDEYSNHECDVTGFSPNEPQHHGEQFVRQSQNALKRGGSHGNSDEVQELKDLEETGIPHDVSNRARYAVVHGRGKARGKKKQLAKKRFGPPSWAGKGGNTEVPDDGQGGGQGKGKGKGKNK